MRIVDVSSNNHPGGAPIDWPKVAAAGVDGVYVKATEGVGYRNPWFTADAEGALAAGLLVGVYHFARFDESDPTDEARWFLRTVGTARRDLPHALDLETGEQVGWGRLGWCRDMWVAEVERAGLSASMYVNRYYLANLPGGVNGRRLWLAAPGATPGVPCWLWQHGVGPVDGIVGNVDLNELVGPVDGPGKEGGGVKLNQPIVGGPILTPTGKGYWLVAADGGVFSFGDAWIPSNNPLPAMTLAAPITGATCTASGRGLLLAGADGGVFALGDAPNFGSIPSP